MKRTIFEVPLFFLFSLLLTCTPITETAKPEKYPDALETSRSREEVEKELSQLSKTNPVLAEELRRLPELKKGLNEKALLTLNRIATFYTQSANPEGKQVFDKILSIGKKERRKFSAPLQALFWLLENEEPPLNERLLDLYSREEYSGFNKKLGEEEEVIHFVYNIWRKTYDTEKWKNPNEIIDRLNSPHLFDLFFGDNIQYDYDKRNRTMADGRYNENWASYLQSPKVTLERRKGTCQDAANLAVKILGKAGYDVKPLQVKFRSRDIAGSNRHWVAVLKEDGLFYKIGDDSYVKEGIVGPFRSIKEIAEKVAENLGTLMDTYSLSQIPIR